MRRGKTRTLERHMTLTEHEQRFVDALRRAGVKDFKVSRHDDDTLLVSIASPCTEIGGLNAYVRRDEVMLSCNMTHTHLTERAVRQNGAGDLTQLASRKIADLLADRIAISKETAPNGHVISTGWCPVDAMGQVTPEYAALIAKQYGGPSRTEYWFWSGKRVAL
jgi:hypothetical protein